jgi:hypothetical protein
MVSKSKPVTRNQVDRFVETARQLGCDEDEKAFDEKLKKIASPKPSAGKAKGKAT